MDSDNYTPIAHWKSIEYEYATCSNCGFNEYTDWDSTDEAKEKIKTFHETYRYCPGCGSKMVAPVDRRRRAEMNNDHICPNLHENEYGEKVCRYTDCPCHCHSRKDCTFSTCFDGVPSEFDE